MKTKGVNVCTRVCVAGRGKELDTLTSNMKRFVQGRQRDTYVWEASVLSVLPSLQADIDAIR
jgi:hypothetical protein